jgi:hypothetical protein
VIRNTRFFLRPIEDVSAGGMTSIHSRITLEGNKLRGELHIRDCENQISLDFWSGEGAKPGGLDRMKNALTQLQDEIDGFIRDYEHAAEKLDD